MPRHSLRAHLAGVLTLVVYVGCAGTSPDLEEIMREQAAGGSASGPVPAAVQQPAPRTDVYGPEILLPSKDTTDGEVARVGDRVLRKSHVYDRLLAASPDASLEVVDLLILDILVAEQALSHGIRVDPEYVDALAEAEKKQLQEQVLSQFGGQVDYAEYVRNTFQMLPEQYLQVLRLRVAQLLYYSYTIRYLAMLEDRVQVRFLANKNRTVLEDVVDRVSQGADFATLARRYSEDETTRREGGLLTPFGAGFPHPIAEPAMELKRGELSEIIEADVGGSPRYYLVYCLERFAKREVTFEEVHEELDGDLERHPLTRLEQEAFALRYRGDMEARKAREGR